MTTDRWIHVIAGILIGVTVALGAFVTKWVLIVTAFVGANLFQYGFSQYCPMGVILHKLGVHDGCPSCTKTAGGNNTVTKQGQEV